MAVLAYLSAWYSAGMRAWGSITKADLQQEETKGRRIFSGLTVLEGWLFDLGQQAGVCD